MSRGNVFKLSGNLALGGTPDTYSTSELESIKSSLRLLKARQSQKKSQQNIDINNNYGASYSSNTGQRADMKRNDNNKDYNYFQSNAKNHVPSYDNGYSKGYEQPVGRTNSKTSIYQNDRGPQNRDRNGNISSMAKNDYNYNGAQDNDYKNTYNQPSRTNDYAGSRNNDYSQGSKKSNYDYGYNEGPKDMSARNPIKNRTQQPKSYNDEDHYNQKPAFNPKNNQQPRSNNNTQTRPPLRKQQINHQASNYNAPNAPVQNDFQEKSLKQVNRAKNIQIVEYDPSTFVQCSVGCGRKFNPDSVSKHQAICFKVFQKKRKQFNAQQQRVLDENHNKILKKTVVEEKRNQAKKKNGKTAKNDQKMSKWKAQSLAFRAMLKDNNGQPVSAEQQRQLDQIKNVGMIKCPTCGRTFNETAGPKHIAFCEAQSKKNKMKR